jgi:hypothetical protein
MRGFQAFEAPCIESSTAFTGTEGCSKKKKKKKTNEGIKKKFSMQLSSIFKFSEPSNVENDDSCMENNVFYDLGLFFFFATKKQQKHND